MKATIVPSYGSILRVDIGLYPISRYNRRIDAGYLHFCPINITFTWVMNKTPRKMYKTKRPLMYKSAVIKSYISKMFICVGRKWCYHFFHVKMRMILSFWKSTKTVIQKCTNTPLTLPRTGKWTFTFIPFYVIIRMITSFWHSTHTVPRDELYASPSASVVLFISFSSKASSRLKFTVCCSGNPVPWIR